MVFRWKSHQIATKFAANDWREAKYYFIESHKLTWAWIVRWTSVREASDRMRLMPETLAYFSAIYFRIDGIRWRRRSQAKVEVASGRCVNTVMFMFIERVLFFLLISFLSRVSFSISRFVQPIVKRCKWTCWWIDKHFMIIAYGLAFTMNYY